MLVAVRFSASERLVERRGFASRFGDMNERLGELADAN